MLPEKQDSQFRKGLNRGRLVTDTPSSDPNGKRRVGPAKLPGNPNKKRIISQDNDSLSLFTPSDVEEELQQDEDGPLRKVMLLSMIQSHSQRATLMLMTFCAT